MQVCISSTAYWFLWRWGGQGEFMMGTALVVASVVLVVVTETNVVVVLVVQSTLFQTLPKLARSLFLSSVRWPVWVLAEFSEKSKRRKPGLVWKADYNSWPEVSPRAFQIPHIKRLLMRCCTRRTSFIVTQSACNAWIRHSYTEPISSHAMYKQISARQCQQRDPNLSLLFLHCGSVWNTKHVDMSTGHKYNQIFIYTPSLLSVIQGHRASTVIVLDTSANLWLFSLPCMSLFYIWFWKAMEWFHPRWKFLLILLMK